MPTVYVKMFDQHDQDVIWPYIYGKNGKKRKRPEALKPSSWQKLKDGYTDLFNMIKGKRPHDNRL